MDFQYFGGNCIRISSKKASIIIDDTLSDLGLSSVSKPGEVALFTDGHGEPGVDVKIIIDSPGEYEVSDVSVVGVPARAHLEEEGKFGGVIYKLEVEDLRIAVVGHVYPELTESQLETIGTVDVLIIPVGGNGYTLDGIGALKLIKKIEPKVVIPTHYADAKTKYPVVQADLETALKNMSMEPTETVDKLKLKPSDLTDMMRLIVLNRQ
jgi:L-ascorbate metabolism protein UlaG (beta-lactamase superfamily)